jgi:hypothetical protein
MIPQDATAPTGPCCSWQILGTHERLRQRAAQLFRACVSNPATHNATFWADKEQDWRNGGVSEGCVVPRPRAEKAGATISSARNLSAGAPGRFNARLSIRIVGKEKSTKREGFIH